MSRGRDEEFLYRVKIGTGYSYYYAQDAIMAMTMALEDGYKDFMVEDVYDEDVDIINFIVLKKMGKL